MTPVEILSFLELQVSLGRRRCIRWNGPVDSPCCRPRVPCWCSWKLSFSRSNDGADCWWQRRMVVTSWRDQRSVAWVSFKVAPSFWFLNINVSIFCWNHVETVSGRRGSNFLALRLRNVDQTASVFLYVLKSVFWKKFSKWPVTPTFFSEGLFSSTSSCEGVKKKVALFMFKIPDFSLAPCLCKQAGLDLVSAWKDLDPRTLVSDLRHFCMTVRCAAHCAGATLNFLSEVRRHLEAEHLPCIERSFSKAPQVDLADQSAWTGWLLKQHTPNLAESLRRKIAFLP